MEIVSGDPAQFVRGLKQQDGMGIWLCGGGKLAAQLRDEIDELIVKRHPIVIGSGISMFDGSFEATRFVLATIWTFDTGVQFLTYAQS